MHDLAEDVPGIEVKGIDISDYAIKNSIKSMRDHFVWKRKIWHFQTMC